MSDANPHEMTAKVSIPSIDAAVEGHFDRARAAIDAMSQSRRYGAETSIRAWRRVLRTYDPEGQNGFAFRGDEVLCRAELDLRVGAIVVGLDDSYARARWYAGCYIPPRASRAFLQRVGPDGLEMLIEVDRSPWAPKLLGFLATHPEICRFANVSLVPAGATGVLANQRSPLALQRGRGKRWRTAPTPG